MGSKTMVQVRAGEAPAVLPVFARCKGWLQKLYAHWCESFMVTGVESPEQANLFWQRWH
jgi:hypothetical protein